jgi:hypothetical protein
MIAQRHLLPDYSSTPINFASCNLGGKAGPPRILSIGRDASMISTRACNLSSATGCSMKSTAPEAISNLVIANFYRVALFDDSLCDAETAELAVCAYASDPGTKLLLIVGSTPRPTFIEALFDVVVFDSEGPSALTGSVQNLLSAARLHATNYLRLASPLPDASRDHGRLPRCSADQ